jgi:hypothetical protein
MPAENTKIIDFQAYRDARRKATAPSLPAQAATAPAGLQPMVMWVPVWAYFPVIASPWAYAQ